MRMIQSLACAGVALVAVMAAPVTAPAASLDTARQIVSGGSVPVEFARGRGHRGGFAHRGGFRRGFAHRGGYRRGWRGRGYGYGYGYRRRGYGPGLGLGLATGAIIGGALAAQAAAPPPVAYSGDVVAYCSQRFKSYDPASGTYLGYDGNRHSCP